ncbi:Putative ABC transporter ATP binding protein [hydrothermal vent metagenome]|uniref:Putative ABC transporter ATP binding protein n=1 Tax=hydrothermal vent metagenome TaxID=652676 RepID=A0A1W1C5M8_9ZZZZ
MKLLEAKNISHHYDYQLFEDISIDLDESCSIAIIGKSGSGKSTLLNILSTLLQPDSGSVKLFGEDVVKMKPKTLTQIKRKDLGIVFQSHYLFKGFSAYENLEVASLLSNEKIDDALLKKLDILECISQKVTELSGGQQQRVSIARVLTKKPRIIFADEPTGNLDKDTAHVVMDLFFEYIKEQNAGMILVTHDEELAYRCKEVYRLQDRELKKEK